MNDGLLVVHSHLLERRVMKRGVVPEMPNLYFFLTIHSVHKETQSGMHRIKHYCTDE
jgi:hypothetical protein